jgi:hypothetical protein
VTVKVFVSSLVRGLEPYRDAVDGAAKLLGHDVKRSEDFAASPDTPQRACLAGVRWSDVVVLLLGPRYGDRQPSGMSATHEEYREARQEQRDVLAFLQRDAELEPDQQAFVDEVRGWEGGVLTGGFATSEELEAAVTRALHDLELARQTAPLDESEVSARAVDLVPDRRDSHGGSLCIAVAGGPRRQVIRPAELEDPELQRDLHREVLLGEHAAFDTTEGVRTRIDGSAFRVEQDHASLLVDALGSVCLVRSALDREASGLPVIIEEDLSNRIAHGLRLAGWILDRIDHPRRLTHVAPAVALLSASYLGWQTRAEHVSSPNTVQMPMNVGDRVVVTLTPAVHPRASLTHTVGELTEDFVALLRQAYSRR